MLSLEANEQGFLGSGPRRDLLPRLLLRLGRLGGGRDGCRGRGGGGDGDLAALESSHATIGGIRTRLGPGVLADTTVAIARTEFRPPLEGKACRGIG